MANVRLKVTTVNEKKLANELINAEKKVDRLQGKLDKTGRTGKKAFKGIGDELTSFALKVAAPTLAINKVITSARELHREIRQLNKEALEKGVTTSQARAPAVLNLADFQGGGVKGAASLDKIVKQVQRTAGGTFADIYSDAALILSRREGQGKEVVRTALKTAAQLRLATDGRVEGGEVASAALSLPKITGSKQASANVGRLLQFQATVPSADPTSLMKILPAYKVLTEMGVPEEKTLEYISAIANSLKDVDLSKTATGAAGLFAGIKGKPVFPTERIGKTGRRETTLGLTPGRDINEQLKNLREAFQKADETTRTKILAKIPGRALFKEAFVRPFLLETDSMKKTLASVDKQIEKFSESAALQKFRTTMSTIFGGPIGRRGARQIQAEAVSEQLQFGRATTPSAIEEQSRLAYQNALTSGGLPRSDPRRMLQEATTSVLSLFGASPTKGILAQAKTTRDFFQTGKATGAESGLMASTFRKQQDAFDRLIIVLEKNQAELEKISGNTEDNANASNKTAGNTDQGADPNVQEIN